jgi:hypothetical protein
MYCSIPDDKIYQKKPIWSQPSAHKLKSWTETVEGYLNEAKKLTNCLFRNRKLAKEPYTWFVTIYVDVVMQPKAVNEWWKKAVRNLQRNGVIALWVREPTSTNKVHYHLLLRSRHAKRQLVTIIEESLPDRKLGRWHKNIKPVEGSDWRLLHYISKAKTPGKTKSGTFVKDLYAKKRLLFKSGLGIRKHGTIGAFWVKSKEAIWSEVKAKEKRIAEGLAQPNVKRLAEYAYEFVGGYVPLRQIERNFGYYSDSPATINWIEQVFGHETNASPNAYA